MMVNKKVLLGFVFGMFLIVCSYSVIAATTWRIPAASTNHSSAISFAVTFVNLTDIMDPVAANTSLSYSIDDQVTWTNLTFTGFSQNGTDVIGTIAITSISDSTSVYLNMTIGNDTDVNITSGISGVLRIDDTPPNVTSFTVQGVTNYYNYSDISATGGLIYLNVSVNDNLDGVLNLTSNISSFNSTDSPVYFIVTTSAGVANGTYYAINQTILNASTWFSITLNTTNFAEGVYNITAYARDLVGNVNSTVIIKSITFDHSAPTVTFACTPASLNVGGTVTCTCTGTDSTTMGTASFTALPGTGSVGVSSTQTCTIADLMGYTGTATTTYRVTSGSSSSTGSSGTSTTTWTKTVVVTTEQFKEGATQKVAAKERIKITVAGGTHYVGVKSMTSTSATIEVASDPITVILNVGEDAKVDVDKDGIYDLYVKLNSIVNNKADVLVKELSEAVPEGAGAVSTTGEIEGTDGGATTADTGGMSKSLIWIIAIVVVVLVGVGFILKKKK